ncbi:bifunctional diguanylate cyclase/phosphodiesterase [uncultured Pseudoteredinibacter sp.]|uniref:bifunctional diguanylate cyclase/phosphodiesterase n=1 Tax=uncultured Pseudoteredinibacter sp. TaxID=1641701 RepID=UPI00261F83CA|nr:bifunctional diguanylate cyclase/phosphodiesterase [uncultured Pseudoteredinibacter sp.]
MKSSISKRLFVIFLGLHFITIFIFWSSSQILLEKLNKDLLNAGEQHLKITIDKEILNSQLLIANTISKQLNDPIYNYDFSKIKNIIDDINDNTPLQYIYVYDKEGNIIHDGSEDIDNFGLSISEMENGILSPAGDFSLIAESSLIHVSAPVKTSNHIIGGFSYATTHNKRASQLEEFNQKIKADSKLATQKTVLWFTFLSLLLFVTTLPLISNLSKRFTYPIRYLSKVANSLIKGESSGKFTLDQPDEIGDLSHSLQAMTQQLKESNEQLSEIAFTDELTGLMTRRKFKQEVESRLSTASLEENFAILMIIDVDRFKIINDSLGHHEGDKALQLIGESIRELDIGLDNILSARIGGDEFALFYSLSKDRLQDLSLHQFGEASLASIVVATNAKRKNQPQITLSAGASIAPIHTSEYSELLKFADLSLYSSKRNGRDQFTLFNEDIAHKYRFRQDIIDGFMDALTSGQLSLRYQAIFSDDSTAPIAYECLSRWLHPIHGNISPEVFVPLLEKSGKIHHLSLWVLDQVLKHAKEIQSYNHNNELLFSINLSAADIMHREYSNQISERLIKARQTGIRLCLEITETGMMTNLDIGREQLTQWRAEGAEIWIDDFGTGYSSLSYLHNLPINIVKLDKSFVKNLDSEHNDAIIEAVCAITDALSLTILAEGIESSTQAQRCKDYGIKLQQGFYYSKPLSIKQIRINQASENIHYAQ